jgi:S1-C subfamily serine protease
MHTNMSHHTSPHRQLWLLYVTSALAIAFFTLLAFIGITPASTLHATGNPGGDISDPVVRAVDMAKPAVVRIFTNINSQLTVKFSPKQSITFPLGGGNYTSTFTGSGTFISAHGDILTADHVINPPHDDQLSQDLDMQAAPDIADYINKYVPSDSPVTQDEVTQELSSGQLASHLRYGKTQSLVYFSTDYSGSLTVTKLHKVPVQLQAPIDRIEAQSAADAKDVAIVHVNLNDTASVQLGDSSSVHEQDMLTIIGFPGNGDVSDMPTNLLTSSVNQIMVSSLKTTDQGAHVIQVGGNVEDGDSGGPALDSNGNVVGIVSFGLSGQGGTNFLQASNSARALVQSLHLDTTPGPFEKAWSQAFNDFAATTPGHWHKTLQELGSIYTNYPQFKAVMPYLQYAQTQAQQERVQQSRPTSSIHPQGKTNSPLVWTILAAMVIIVLALALRRRKKNLFLPQTPGRVLVPLAGTMPATLPPLFLPQTHAVVPLADTRDADVMLAFDAPTTRQRKKKGPLTPVILQPLFPTQTQLALQDTDELVVFGAPSTTLRQEQVSVQSQPSGPLAGMLAANVRTSDELRPELNPKNARFYSMWGGPVVQEYIAENELEATPILD